MSDICLLIKRILNGIFKVHSMKSKIKKLFNKNIIKFYQLIYLMPRANLSFWDLTFKEFQKQLWRNSLEESECFQFETK